MKGQFEVGGTLAPPFVVISVEKSDLLADTNQERTRALDEHLKEIRAFSIWGCYNGKVEASRLVHCQKPDVIFTQLERIAHRYGQESILYVDATGNAYFIITEDNENRYRVLPAGKWRQISAVESMYRIGWTRDENGIFYGTD